MHDLLTGKVQPWPSRVHYDSPVYWRSTSWEIQTIFKEILRLYFNQSATWYALWDTNSFNWR